MNSKVGAAFAASVAVLLLAGCGESASGASSVTAQQPAASKAAAVKPASLASSFKLKTCKVGQFGVEFTGTLVNPSKEVSDFIGTVEITNAAGDRVDEGGIVESKVKPGQKVNVKGVGLEQNLKGKVTCSVQDVTRVKSQP